MPSKDFIDVRVHVDGQPLREYTCPDEAETNGLCLTRYIEVKAGQRFTVMCRALSGYPLHNAPFLYFGLHVDNHSIGRRITMILPDVKSKGNVLYQERSDHFEKVTALDHATGQWHEAYYTFGALGRSEDSFSTDKQKFQPAMIDKIGSVTVQAFRAKARKLEQPYIWHGNLEQTPDQLPENVLKGRDVKNNVKYELGKASVAEPPLTTELIPLNDVHGQKYTFRFLCRSKKALQNLGCIPRSPSPPPDPNLIIARNEALLAEIKNRNREANKENVRLREELARARYGHEAGRVVDLDDDTNTNVNTGLWIKHEPGIKQEPEANSSTTTRGIKRKADNDHDRNTKRMRSTTVASSANTLADEDDAIVEVPAPPKPAPEFIDLTDD